jgi:hypothetical protein
MITQKIYKSIIEDFFLNFILCDVKIYVFIKKCMSNSISKYNFISKKLKWFLFFMKVEDIFNYLISHSLNRVCEPHEEFENFHVKKGF